MKGSRAKSSYRGRPIIMNPGLFSMNNSNLMFDNSLISRPKSQYRRKIIVDKEPLPRLQSPRSPKNRDFVMYKKQMATNKRP
jgi:hypothetical protein